MIKIGIKNKKSMDSSFLEPKEYLNRDFWDEKVLFPEIEEALLDIASNIVESMNIEAEIKDIIITGSIASYNWHDLSDVDLHIVLDFSQINEDFEIVKRMLDQSRINWNKTHDIFIRGHEVELYFQDISETHESNGVWSLTKKIWNKEPTQDDVEIDLFTTEKKAEMIAKSIDHVQELYNDERYKESYDLAGKIKLKISRMRKMGLAKEGIYSPENLAFKMLRNSKYLEKLSTLKVSSYDRKMSVNEMYLKDYFSEKLDDEHLIFGDGGGPEDLLDPDAEAPWEKTEKEDV